LTTNQSATNKASISIVLGGYNFKAEEITELVGLEPTFIINGNTKPGALRPAISSWELSSDTVVTDIDDDLDIFSMINDFIKTIEPAKEQLLKAVESYNLVPKIVVRMSLSMDKEATIPELGFGSRAVKFLASLGAFIEIETKKI